MNAKISFVILAAFVLAVKAGPTERSQDSNIFLNDMRFPDDDDRSAIASESRRWPSGIVPYKFDSSFTSKEQAVLNDGLKMISDTTCIKFQPFSSKDRSYVSIVRGEKGSGCYSYVGMAMRGAQALNIEPNSYCMQPGPVAHEMLHAIGLHHEMSRPDRDDYIVIQYENMQTGAESNFKKEPNSLTYGTKYDYTSIMHYGSRAGSKNGKPVMLDNKRKEITMGQLKKLTESDVAKVKAMYKCP